MNTSWSVNDRRPTFIFHSVTDLHPFLIRVSGAAVLCISTLLQYQLCAPAPAPVSLLSVLCSSLRTVYSTEFLIDLDANEAIWQQNCLSFLSLLCGHVLACGVCPCDLYLMTYHSDPCNLS